MPLNKKIKTEKLEELHYDQFMGKKQNIFFLWLRFKGCSLNKIIH